MSSERREHLRISLTGKVDIKAEGIIETLNCQAINISKGGAAIYSEKPFEINAELVLTIFFKNVIGERFEEISGKIRWIKPVGNEFAIGVQFTETSRESHPLIHSYLEANE